MDNLDNYQLEILEYLAGEGGDNVPSAFTIAEALNRELEATTDDIVILARLGFIEAAGSSSYPVRDCRFLLLQEGEALLAMRRKEARKIQGSTTAKFAKRLISIDVSSSRDKMKREVRKVLDECASHGWRGRRVVISVEEVVAREMRERADQAIATLGRVVKDAAGRFTSEELRGIYNYATSDDMFGDARKYLADAADIPGDPSAVTEYGAAIQAIERQITEKVLAEIDLLAMQSANRDVTQAPRESGHDESAEANKARGAIDKGSALPEASWIERLIAEAKALKYGDDSGEDRLLKRARMLLKTHLGAESADYLENIDNLQFHGMNLVQEVPEQGDRTQWSSARAELVNTLEVAAEHLAIPVASVRLSPASPSATSSPPAAVFVVHGHNAEMKEAVARTLMKLGLQCKILHELPNQGRTIIEKFEEVADSVNFAIVTLSPDDRVSDANGAVRLRPRQNVIFELGYFIGKLGRSRVVALVPDIPKEQFEYPSDYDGVIYTRYDSVGHWRFELVRELKAARYRVSADDLM